MDLTSQRPTSVWITQVIVAIVILVGIVFLPLRLWSLGSCTVENSSQSCDWITFLSFLRDGLLWGLAVDTFQGLKARKPYGRSLGVSFLLIMMLFTIGDNSYVQLLYGAIANGQPLPTPPYECWSNTNSQIEQEFCGYATYRELWLHATLGFLFPSSLFALLAARLASSDDTNRFFQD